MAKADWLFVAVDDGYAQTKVYGADPKGGKPIRQVFRSSARSGRYGLQAIGGEGATDCYRTEEGDEFTVSEEVEAENTQFNGFHTSTMNRALVHHGLANAGYSGREISLMTGLPVADYFDASGGLNKDHIQRKRQNLLKGIERVSSQDPLAKVSAVDVGCQAVAAWVDYAFDDKIALRQDPKGRVAIVDVGGRTTDIAVVVGGQTIDFKLSGTRNAGVLDVYSSLQDGIRKKFDIRDEIQLALLDQAVRTGKIKMYGKPVDVSDLVKEAVVNVEGLIAREIDRKIGGSLASLQAVVFTGGGGALFQHMASKFPNGVMIDDPEFANARGLYKFAEFRKLKGPAKAA